MRNRIRALSAAVLVAAALVATGCSSNDPTPGPDAGGGEVVLRGCTAQNPLLGLMTNEVCGGHVLDVVTSQLMRYDAETAAPVYDIAESITTDDAQIFTVKLKKGYLFSDGTEVKAENFVRAWNYGAYAPNGMAQATFFEPIAGFADLQCADDDCDANKPLKEELEGLEVVDDHTFIIRTTEPTSNMEVRLGYTVFAPLPEAFFADPKSAEFGRIPIGSGPYKVTSNTATEIVMEPNEHYTGAFKGKVDRIVYRIYNDSAAGWADMLAGNLDFDDNVPPDQLVGDAWIAQVGAERTVVRTSGTIEVLTVSPNDPQFKDNPKLRQAIGQAIDRETITREIYGGSRTPATGWVAPVVDGYLADQCGKACVYDPTQAKIDYDAAGGYQGILTVSVNGDGGHKEWAEAVCNNLRNNLGADCIVNITPDFRTLLNQARDGELMGLFRNGWVMDYPSIENFLTPIYRVGAASNYSGYNNPEFESLLVQAAAATNLTQANELYQQAEATLALTYPTLPMWYRTTPAAWSTRVDNVVVTKMGWIDATQVTVRQP
ncbi:MAG: ABC transporter substrate-binding protein [Propionibacteriaceae bacterium]|jgi:oligopeptide transport system substrate-binding protein|nr:ABC transporter substrate-binding protein [Propionibacteriaceae bacterium]